MAEQRLDYLDIGAVFQQVRREAVAQRVRSDPLGDLCRPGSFDTMRWSWRVLIGFMACWLFTGGTGTPASRCST